MWLLVECLSSIYEIMDFVPSIGMHTCNKLSGDGGRRIRSLDSSLAIIEASLLLAKRNENRAKDKICHISLSSFSVSHAHICMQPVNM